METHFFATESELIGQDQTNLDIMSNLIISNDSTILNGKYEIKREIARGGMGIVFEAYNLYNYKTVAIKMILADKIEPIQLKRFQKEIEAYRLLSHPNVIAIYDAGIYNNYPYIVMEYIKGVDICTYFKKYKEKDWKLCARLIYEVALGLEYIHSQKMIHRDIKPSNIIVRPNGRPVIIDLGLVKFNRSQSYNLTQSKEIVGTIEYMPIEQAQGKGGQIDVRTDVYSLGLVLYELLTEQRAYNGENLMELCYKIMTYYPPAPRKINPQIPEALEKITLHAIEKQKEKRYTSMKKFATALKEYLNDTPVKTISQYDKYDKWINPEDKNLRIWHNSNWFAVLLAIIFVTVIVWMIIIMIIIPRNTHSQNEPKIRKHIEKSLDSENNQSKNYELLLESANKGDAEAQCELGIMYYNGQDYANAREYFEQSVSQENAKALFYLGLMRSNGYGVPEDLEIAKDCFEKSANQGNAEAQYQLGLMYSKGDGVSIDIEEAIHWLKKSANQGNAEAQYKLGDIYYNGQGGKRDHTQAFHWYYKAAYNGNKYAQGQVSNMYSNGDGVTKNSQMAKYWWEQATRQ